MAIKVIPTIIPNFVFNILGFSIIFNICTIFSKKIDNPKYLLYSLKPNYGISIFLRLRVVIMGFLLLKRRRHQIRDEGKLPKNKPKIRGSKVRTDGEIVVKRRMDKKERLERVRKERRAKYQDKHTDMLVSTEREMLAELDIRVDVLLDRITGVQKVLQKKYEEWCDHVEGLIYERERNANSDLEETYSLIPSHLEKIVIDDENPIISVRTAELKKSKVILKTKPNSGKIKRQHNYTRPSRGSNNRDKKYLRRQEAKKRHVARAQERKNYMMKVGIDARSQTGYYATQLTYCHYDNGWHAEDDPDYYDPLPSDDIPRWASNYKIDENLEERQNNPFYYSPQPSPRQHSIFRPNFCLDDSDSDDSRTQRQQQHDSDEDDYSDDGRRYDSDEDDYSDQGQQSYDEDCDDW